MYEVRLNIAQSQKSELPHDAVYRLAEAVVNPSTVSQKYLEAPKLVTNHKSCLVIVASFLLLEKAS